MKFRIILISLIIFVFTNNSFYTINKTNNTLACLEIKRKAPYLNLNCDNINHKNSFKRIFFNKKLNQKIKKITSEDIIKNTKEINDNDKIKLKDLIRKLRN